MSTRARHEERHAAWRAAVALERRRWASGNRCLQCGCWVGHWAGGWAHDESGQQRRWLCACPSLPMDVPLQEVRPGCMTVRRRWLCDAIRAAEKRARERAKQLGQGTGTGGGEKSPSGPDSGLAGPL